MDEYIRASGSVLYLVSGPNKHDRSCRTRPRTRKSGPAKFDASNGQGNTQEGAVRSYISWGLLQAAITTSNMLILETPFTVVEASGERAPKLANTPHPWTINNQWNGDPMHWGSWPIGRRGPFVSEARMQRVIDVFHYFNIQRGEQSRTEDNVLHIAEFSSSGHGESDLYRSSPE